MTDVPTPTPTAHERLITGVPGAAMLTLVMVLIAGGITAIIIEADSAAHLGRHRGRRHRRDLRRSA